MAAYATLAFLSFLWGSSFPLIKIAAEAFTPLGFALARVAVAAATLIVAGFFLGGLWPGWRPGLWANLVALSALGQVLPFLLLGRAAKLTGSADMAVMMAAAPIFVFVIGRFLRSGDRWTLPGALGLALGFLGVGFALWAPSSQTAAASPVEGRALALAAAFCYATSTLISGAATREIGAVKAVAASMTLSTLALAAVALISGGPLTSAEMASAGGAPIVAMATLGVFNTGLAYFIYFRLVVGEGPTFASLNNYLVPLIGVLGGAAALGERIAASVWVGLALVLAGVVLTGSAVRSSRGG
jgi:drug/metabolite transporter (DMT)-like permease